VASLSGMTNNQRDIQFTTSQNLRKIRKSKGWSLQDVELKSKGKWKAVVVGSYERSDRAISLKKAIDLMAFYEVPMTELFAEKVTSSGASSINNSIIIDQRALSKSSDTRVDGAKRMISSLAARRKDWNGEVLSLRSSDLQFLSILLDLNDDETMKYLKDGGYLIS
jgi:transcriptional regulator with XRE-family HTH domain